MKLLLKLNQSISDAASQLPNDAIFLLSGHNTIHGNAFDNSLPLTLFLIPTYQ